MECGPTVMLMSFIIFKMFSIKRPQINIYKIQLNPVTRMSRFSYLSKNMDFYGSKPKIPDYKVQTLHLPFCSYLHIFAGQMGGFQANRCNFIIFAHNRLCHRCGSCA